MCKPNIHSRARRPSKSSRAELNLLIPYVPLADPTDGLIKTEDLLADIIVEVTVWEGAKPQDHLQLTLNDLPVGDEYVLDNPIQGTIIEVKIPTDTALKDDGIYELRYVTQSFPGGNSAPSPPAPIKVDRTAAGAHQLGYMDFPDEAKDGLTAAELNAMGDTLTGRIYGYTGLSAGDTITTYWGEILGPDVLLTGSEDGNQPIDVHFDKAFLVSLGNNPGATYYKVKDRAGNISNSSKMVTIPLFLTEIVTDLAAPVVQNYDGMIDYTDAQATVSVGIPASEILQDQDSILLRWGTVSVGPYPVEADDLGEEYVLIFEVSFATIEEAGNGIRQLRYDVIRDNHTIGVSTSVDIVINIETPVPGNPDKPTIKGGSSTPSAEDNVIDENDFELDATVIINWNEHFSAAQMIQVFWGGEEVLDVPYVITNTDVAAGRPLLLSIPNSNFTQVGTGPDIRVYYTVSQADNPNTSKSEERGIIVRSKEEIPGGTEGLDAPQFERLNANGAINRENSVNGAPIYIKPYINIDVGQTIVFTYEAYDDLVAGGISFIWTHTSPPLTTEQVTQGYRLNVPRNELLRHCYGHAETSFQVLSDTGSGNSKSASAYVDLRVAGVCTA